MAVREPAPEEPTIGKLVVDAIDDTGALVRNIIELAKAELKVSFGAGIVAIALFFLAGFVALLGIIMASVAIAYFIAMSGLDLAWSFLIVFGGYLVLAGLLGFLGYLKIRKVKAPQRTIAQAQELPRAFSHGS
ncbi:MAG: phage holin family protein [Marmoricola sp.]